MLAFSSVWHMCTQHPLAGPLAAMRASGAARHLPPAPPAGQLQQLGWLLSTHLVEARLPTVGVDAEGQVRLLPVWLDVEPARDVPVIVAGLVPHL